MQEIKRVAIQGAGAMGAVYASKFFASADFSTTLVARGERYERLKRDGLTVNETHIPVTVTHPDEVDSPADLILVALKQYHLPEAIHDLDRFVGPQTTIISVMNGLDSEDYLGSVFGMDKLLYCVAVGIDALREGSGVVYTKVGKLYFGEAVNNGSSPRVVRTQEAFERAGIPSEVPTDMMRTLWWKFMINVGVNQASAVLRAPYAVFQTQPDARFVMQTLMREVSALAEAAGIDLGEKDVQGWDGVLNTLSPTGKTSMLQDVEAGRKTEVEIFAGKVVALGEQYSVATPANRLFLHMLRTLEGQA
jgi:2-dehydropantoate 2-reductase